MRTTAWIALLCLGCADDPRVRLDVLLLTDYRPGIDFVEVRAEVLEETSSTRVVSDVESFLNPSDAARLEGLTPAQRRRLQVELVRRDGTVLQRSRTVSFSHERDRQQLTRICAACEEFACPFGQTCECGVEPTCVPEECAEDECAPTTSCGADAECRESGLSCVDEVCREGVCLHAPRDALCRAFQLCDVDEGCVADPRIECTGAEDCPLPRGDCAERVCEGGRCGEVSVPTSCGPAESCVDGTCVAMCASDEDCSPLDACSGARCAEGRCESVDLCGALGCDPELGCVTRSVRIEVEDDTSSEVGDSSSVLVSLTARPTDFVRVLVFASDRSEARASGPALTELVFDASTWRVPQRVAFVGEDDELVDGNRPYEAVAVTFSVESPWDGLRSAAPGLANFDDEVAASGILEVRLGSEVGCARTASEVWCWGSNREGLLGIEPTSLAFSEAPRRVDLAGRIPVRLSVGSAHACMIDSESSLLCWGRNSEGQLGDGSTTSRASPGLVAGIPPVTDVAAGGSRTCAISDERLICWGGSTLEPLGDGTVGPASTPRLIRSVPTGSTLARGESSLPHGFVLRPGSAPLGWGPNGSGQLGIGSFTSASFPTTTLFPPATEMVSSGSVTCALLASDRTMVCAGTGSQFGTGAPIVALSPVAVVDTTFRSLSLVAGVADDGLLWRWGLDWYARTGMPIASPPSRDPSAPTGLTRTASDGFRVCVTDDVGRSWCDGFFPTRELGAPREALGPVTQVWSGFDDVIVRPADPDLALLGIDDVPGSALAVATSGSHSCYVDATGVLWCLGANDDGQLGRGVTSAPQPASRVPVEGPIFRVATGESRLGPMVAGGFAFSCASSATRTWCWGQMVSGPRQTTPTALAALEGRRVVDLEAGGTHACAVVDGGELHCWGYNHAGQLGAPVEAGFGPHLVPLSDVVDVDLGSTHTCALTAAGEVWCFGDNQSIQFAVFSVAFSSEPLRIDLPAAADRLVLGHQAACARLVDGEVWCWGDGGYGNQNFDEESHVPRRIPELAGAEALAATARSEGSGFCGRFADGALRCIDRAAVRPVPWMAMPSP